MKMTTKRNVLAACVIAMAIWPLCHRYLVHKYRLSPWRFFGLAMYCSPKLGADVDAYEVKGDELTRLPLGDDDLELAQKAARRFEKDRKTLGLLVEPVDVAREIFVAREDVQRVELTVEQEYFDAATATIAAWNDVYRYDRSQFTPAP